MENLLRDNKEKLFMVVDCETENVALNEQLNKIWNIAWILYRNDKIEKEDDFYIKWPEGLKVSAQAAKITNFDPNKIDQLGQSPNKVWKELDRVLKRVDIIIAHNGLGFEAYQIPAFYRKLGYKPYNIVPKLLDTFAIAKSVKAAASYNKNENFIAFQYKLIHKIMKGSKTSLGALAKEFEIPHDPTKLHGALADCRINLAIWNKLKYQINLSDIIFQ